MTITQIKQQLDIVSLDLVRPNEKDSDVPGKWLRYWNDQRRLAVVLHEDVLNAIKANTSLHTLGLKYESKISNDKTDAKTGEIIKGKPYDQYILINALSIEESL